MSGPFRSYLFTILEHMRHPCHNVFVKMVPGLILASFGNVFLFSVLTSGSS